MNDLEDKICERVNVYAYLEFTSASAVIMLLAYFNVLSTALTIIIGLVLLAILAAIRSKATKLALNPNASPVSPKLVGFVNRVSMFGYMFTAVGYAFASVHKGGDMFDSLGFWILFIALIGVHILEWRKA